MPKTATETKPETKLETKLEPEAAVHVEQAERLSAAEILDRAVKIAVEKVQPVVVKPALRDRYWVGVIDSSPYDRVDVAGVTFQKMTDPPRFRNGEQYRDVQRGNIVGLSQAEVELVKKKVVTKWFQNSREKEGRIFGGNIRSSENVGFIPTESDQPVAKYLYMQRLREGENPSRSLGVPCPETMA
jgi:hypothetical protein